MTITVYSTTTCPYCKMLKEHLDKHQVNYTNKLVDQDEAARDEMMKESGGFLGVPFTVIKKDDGAKETIVGFDKNKIDGILGLTE